MIWDFLQEVLAHDCSFVLYHNCVNFIIDGYNLLYAIGLASPRTQGAAFRAARKQLLAWLDQHLYNRQVSVHVVFDSMKLVEQKSTSTQGNIEIHYAYNETADDHIERVLSRRGIRGEQLIVISNDQRLHEAARRKGHRAWSTERFLDWLQTSDPQRVMNVKPSDEKDRQLTEAETNALLSVFSQPKSGRRAY